MCMEFPGGGSSIKIKICLITLICGYLLEAKVLYSL